MDVKFYKKIKVIVISICILGTIMAGFTFAITDVGAKLEDWYNSRFGQVTENSEEDIRTQLPEQLEQEFKPWEEENEANSKEELEKTHDSALLNNIGEVYVQKNEYIDRIGETADTVKGNLENDFDQYISEKNEEVNSRIDSEAVDFLEELNGILDEEIGEFNEELDQSSKNAQTSLKNTIDSSKKSIQAQIQSERENAETEVKKNLDEKIETARQDVRKRVEGKIDIVINDIRETSINVEDQALSDMENIIRNINK